MAAIRVGVGDPVTAVAQNDALTERIGSANITANSANVTTTTPTQVMSLTCNLLNGKTYAVTFSGRVSGATAGESGIVRIKTVSATGTDLNSSQVFFGTATNGGWELSVYAEYTAVATAAVTFVVTLERSTTGSSAVLALRASASGPNYVYCDYLGI